MHAHEITGSGEFQHMPADRVQAAQEAFSRDVDFARRAEEHVWIITVVHRLTKEKARQIANEGPESDQTLLDVETVAVTGIGCYVCEQELDPRLIDRRCKGEPKAARRR